MNHNSLLVTVPGPGVHLRVSDAGFPADMVYVAQNVADTCRKLGIIPSVHRIVGGMNVPNPDAMYDYFLNAFGGLNGALIMSGATRCLTESGFTPSVAEVVPFVKKFLPNSVTAGSFPRTEGMTLSGHGTLFVGSEHTVIPNPETEHVVIIQKDGNDDSLHDQWNADLQFYLDYMQLLRDEMGFVPVLTVWEGGGVSVKEATQGNDRGFRVCVAEGSGRACNNQLSPANFNGKNIHHVPYKNGTLQRTLMQAWKISK